MGRSMDMEERQTLVSPPFADHTADGDGLDVHAPAARVLVIGGDEPLAPSLERRLRAAALEIHAQHVPVGDLAGALEPIPDVVVAVGTGDEGDPASEAVQVLAEHDAGVPVVVVLDELPPDPVAGAALRGVADLVPRHDVDRIALAVRQAVARRRERLRAAAVLSEVERRHRELLDNANDIIYVHDAEGRFLLLNQAAVDVSGYDPARFPHLTVFDVLAPESAELVRESVRRARAGLPIERLEVELVRIDGARVPLEVNPRAVYRRDEVVAFEGIARDIRERRAGEAEAAQLMEALERSDAERRRLLRHLSDAQEEERRRIAADIHDDSIQAMVAVGMRLGMLRHRLEDDDDRRELERLEADVRDAGMKLRALIFELRPPALDRDDGLVAAVREHLEELGEDTGIRVHVVDRLGGEPSPEVQTTAFRVVQEAAARVRRHAFAHSLDVTFTPQGDGFSVSIVHDGEGWGGRADAESSGAVSVTAMRERCEIAGGRFSLEDLPGGGTRVEFWLPWRTGETLEAPA